MANIIISDLLPTNSEYNSESFLQELTDADCLMIQGGVSNGYSELINLNIKVLESALIAFAIYNIVALVKLFINSSSSSILSENLSSASTKSILNGSFSSTTLQLK